MRPDTIVAPATPPGRSALAIVRIDGPLSNSILVEITKSGLTPIRAASLVRLFSPEGEELDECVAVRYEAPHSFTGNDLVELSVHGNPMIVSRVVESCLALGARMAEPGEFTERAVLNGKMDLVQAESIADLINARTSLQARVSLSNLEGTLSRKAGAVRQTLLEVMARLEAALDFSEEGYEFIARGEVSARLREALAAMRAMADTYARGRATIEGVSAVILGLPNAGKSTLLNRLVGTDRAIVTPLPGTTRDIVRETIEIGGVPVTLSDTAGLRVTDDPVEGIGVGRARAVAAKADLVLYLVDASMGLSEEDRAELAALPEAIVLYTKADLAEAPAGALSISVASDSGIDSLLRLLDEKVRMRFAAGEGSLVSDRQRVSVEECIDGLLAALGSVDSGVDEQMILVDLYRAANALGRLTGVITNDELMAEIFGKFCIGK